MDPDQVLTELRSAQRRYEHATQGTAEELFASQDLATKFAALDEWLSNGGFLPGDWSR